MVLGLGLLLLHAQHSHGKAGLLLEAWQRGVFDTYQWLRPRADLGRRTLIVAVDDYSIEQLGQWPWPRTRIAALIDTLVAGGAAAIGIDILFSTKDRLSPEHYAEELEAATPELRAALRALPPNDPVLSRALAESFTVLGVALDHHEGGPGLRSAGRVVPPSGPLLKDLPLTRFKSATRSLPVIESRAFSIAMMNGAAEDGVLRRMPLIARLGDSVYTNLGLEVLRVALTDAPLGLQGSPLGGLRLQLAGLDIPISNDGRYWVYFARERIDHRISAANVLRGPLAPDTFKDKLVLIGFMAQGRLDRITTPLGDERPGVEVHAEVIESVVQQQWLERPVWAPWLELTAYALLATAALGLGSTGRVALAAGVALSTLASLPALGFALFATRRWLLDFSLPGLAALGVFAVSLARNLWRTQAERRALQVSLQSEREQQARIAGELEAARRIQSGLLPRVEALARGAHPVEIAAHMEPARSVGGDLYDFFLLDPETLFVCVGDVAGKGVPASLFMALTKATIRSTVQDQRESLADALNAAQAQMQQDNPECMFVTLAALSIELGSGRYAYVNAGHEAPLVRHPAGAHWLAGEGGPPLCVLDDFPYQEHSGTWPPDSLVLMVTDGVTEAIDPAGGFYGRERLFAVIANLPAGSTAQQAMSAVRQDVLAFAAGTDLPDDLAIVAIRVRPAEAALSAPR